MLKYFQKGFNYSQDGPGNRLVYHLFGCNYRCPWCANPEGLENTGQDIKEVSIEEIVEEIERSKMMFFDGGGVTFTGGEATMQFSELKELLKILKQNNINTCLETNGSSPNLKELFPLIDHLIMDIKHYNAEEYLRWTGNHITNNRENFKLICENKISALIRIPLINHVNFNPDEFSEYLSSFNPNCQKFEVLRYHEYGKDKWKTPYKMHDGFITDEQYIAFIKALKEKNLAIINT